MSHKKESESVFSDLLSYRCETGGTIPLHIYKTRERPDIVVVDDSTRSMYSLELTVCKEDSLKSSHNFKVEKYGSLIQAISESTEWTMTLKCVELDPAGNISDTCLNDLTQFISSVCHHKALSHLNQLISQLKSNQ